MKSGVILMIGLGCVKLFQGHDLSHDRPGKQPLMFNLGDVRFRDAFLFVIAVKDHRAILRAGVRPLTIELRGVVNHGEEDFEKLSVGDLRRVKA